MSTLTTAIPVHEAGPTPTLEDMTGSKVAAVTLASVGFVLSMIGLMVGIVSHTVGYTDCGSGFSPNPYIVWTTQCFGLTDGARTLGLVLLVPGIISMLVGLGIGLIGSGMFKRPTVEELDARSHADA